MAAKVIPHFALCGGNDDCLGSREGEKKGKKRKGVNKAARRTKASETHTHQQWHHHRRGEAADQREWRAASSKAAEPPPAAELEHPPAAELEHPLATRLNPREGLPQPWLPSPALQPPPPPPVRGARLVFATRGTPVRRRG